jgi:hypothetical protein
MYILKKAYVFESDVNNLKYLLKHKKHVYTAGRQIDVPRMQLLKHDLSKFTPVEWNSYKEKFHTTDTVSPTEQKAFRKAVETHHYPKNKHHTKHWGGVDKMPYKYKIEALSDWYSVNKTLGKTDLSFKDWFRTARVRGKLGGMDDQTLNKVDGLFRRNDARATAKAIKGY